MPDPVSLGETVFETARLRLEPLRESHAAELFELLSDPRMYPFVPQDAPESLAWLAGRYKKLETRLSGDGSEEWLNWVVRSKADGACIGTVQVTLCRDGRAQLAYEIGAPHWRRGFATEACGRVIEALFKQGATEVWAELDTRNEASIRLLERLGFQRGAFKPKADHFKGTDSDEWTYSLPRPVEPRRMHAAFRLAAFLGLLIAGAAVIGFGWRALGLPRQMQGGVVQPWSLLATGALLVLLGVGVTWLSLRRMEGRGLRTVGLWFAPGNLRRAAIGCFFGGLTPALVASGLAIAGFATITPVSPDLLGITMPMIGAMILISSWEEILLRGYFVQVIGEMGGPWIAAGISGLLFGLMHAGNPGANPAGLIITAANGVLLAMLAVRTGSLWLACWYHAGWNLVAALGFGMRDSGMLSPGAFFSTELHGPTLLTGGSYGFEASLISYFVEAAILVLLLVYAPRWASDPAGWPYYQGKR